MLLDLLCFCDPVHFRHIDVGENHSIAHLAAGFSHVPNVHVNSNQTIRSFVALESELVLDQCSERYQVEEEIVD